jgi:hypothetical protein
MSSRFDDTVTGARSPALEEESLDANAATKTVLAGRERYRNSLDGNFRSECTKLLTVDMVNQ